MALDYYAILGVPPSADLETIQRAYRRKAVECHPDRGGSHRDMVNVNVAWFVLRDLAKRQEYDASRQPSPSPQTLATVSEITRSAREFAQEYPPRAADLEPWLKRVCDDFARARYGSMPGYRGTKLPTAQGSDSAMAFIVVGGGIGLALAASFLGSHNALFSFRAIAFCAGGVTVGAWIGRYLHEAVAEIVRPSKQKPGEGEQRRDRDMEANNSDVQQLTSRVVACKQCRQKIRLPNLQKVLIATCPKCRARFDVAPIGK